VLASLSQEDLDHAVEDGMVSVTCEFCSTTYRFEATEVKPQ
jgi:molecular chaperone Hsp33